MKKPFLFLAPLFLASICSTSSFAACTPSTLQMASFTQGVLITIPAVAGCNTNITDLHATISDFTFPLIGTEEYLEVWPASCANIGGVQIKYGTQLTTPAQLGAKDTFQSPTGLVIKLGVGIAGCVGWSSTPAGNVPQTISFTVSYQ